MNFFAFFLQKCLVVEIKYVSLHTFRQYHAYYMIYINNIHNFISILFN